MPSLKTLVAKLRKDYPELTFKEGERFQFTPPSTVFYADGDSLLLLHELGHYLLERNDYSSDIELVRIESEAWAKAHELCTRYSVKWNNDFAEDRLDTYRDWLHYSSLCKNCELAGYQDDAGIYHCPLCNAKWRSMPPEII